MDQVTFLHGTNDKLPTSRSENSIYHTTDTKRSFIGSEELQNRVSVVNMTDTSATIEPNVLYIWGEVTTLDISLATPIDSSKYNEYMFQFTSGSTATTLSLPDTLTWYAGNYKISENKTYQISIVNDLAILGEF